MSLREQFEKWFRQQHTIAPSTALIRCKLNHDEYACMSVQVEWQAYQAGHAASGRDEMLEACEVLLQFARTEANCDTVAILHPSTSVDWHRGHRAALHLVRDKLEAAIKKTRGE